MARLVIELPTARVAPGSFNGQSNRCPGMARMRIARVALCAHRAGLFRATMGNRKRPRAWPWLSSDAQAGKGFS